MEWNRTNIGGLVRFDYANLFLNNFELMAPRRCCRYWHAAMHLPAGVTQAFDNMCTPCMVHLFTRSECFACHPHHTVGFLQNFASPTDSLLTPVEISYRFERGGSHVGRVLLGVFLLPTTCLGRYYPPESSMLALFMRLRLRCIYVAGVRIDRTLQSGV